MQAKPYLRKIILQRDLINSFNEYPFNIPAIKRLDSLNFHKDVTFIVGENGTGKSTIIEAIALCLGFGLEGGTKHLQLSTHSNASNLHKFLKLIRSYKLPEESFFLRAESFYNVSSYTEDIDPGKRFGEHMHEFSHGESFLKIITEKLTGKGLYIFDEPEAALSPTRQLTAIAAIDNLVKNDSQLIIATHSPILLAYPHAIIYSLDSTGIGRIDYEETDHYNITKQFLVNYKEMIDVLLNNNRL